MKVRLLVSRAVLGDPQTIGDVVEVENAEAVRMIEAGQAEPVRTAPAPEKATRRARKEKAAE